ncbi:putative kelch-type beta propeller [Plasmopara halstedii]
MKRLLSILSTKAHRQEAKKAKQSAKVQEFRKKDTERTQVIIEAVQQPTPRANFTLSALPSGGMLLFGEYFDGDVNDYIIDLIALNEAEMVRETAWKSISSPNTPPPRCSHQSAVYREHLYVFGEEFATADQFHHYRDIWRLNRKTNAWEELEVKGGTSPRGGHRMVVWRNLIWRFSARKTKWFNDLYLFNLVELKWQKILYAPHRQVPAERSGCQLAVHPSKDLIFPYGGYANALNLSPILKRQSPTWEKLSRKGQALSPRSGAAVTVQAAPYYRINVYNDLFTDGKRRRKKKDKMLEDHESDSEKEKVEEDFDAMLEKQFGYVDDEGNIVHTEDAHEKTKEDEEKDESLMIRGSTLYVYGVVVEDGDREITLDDCWSLDLKRLDE